MRLKGKVAIVTGAAQGMGASISRLFIQEGARVAMVDINGAKLSETARELESFGEKPLTLVIDISDSTAVKTAVAKVKETWERVDVLVNNAAVQSPGGNIVQATDADWDRYFNVNVKGAAFLCREVIPIMQQQHGGSIINISSISGLMAFPGQAVYAPSKAAVQTMTRNIALDFGKDNIRANSICPGPTLSGPLLSNPSPEKEAGIKNLAAQHPLGRNAMPEDIAYAALFLASDEARHITGVILPVDGGFTIK
jgi:NAD(P)-dependent dehydrogenase (short-subunit alcohol dehydrogenase family)